MSVSVDDIKREILSQLQQGSQILPGLPDIATRVRKLIAQDDADINTVSKLIQTDIPLAARLVQIANSPMYRGVTPVQNCQKAVSRLGLDVTRNLVTSFAMRRVFFAKSANTRQQMEHLWKHSVKVAAIAYVLARITPDLDPERALLAGLIHDIGVLPLLNYLDQNKAVVDDATTFEILVASLRAPLGVAVLKYWRFDDDFLGVVEHAENWSHDHAGSADYADTIIVAQKHAEFVEKKLKRVETIPAMRRFPVFKLGEGASFELISEAQDEIVELQKLLKSE